MRIFRGAIAGLVLSAVAQAAAAEEMNWQEAVAELAAERTRAETCVRLLKRHAGDDAATLSRGELAYADAKAHVDSVIAGLTVALEQGEEPESFSTLGGRLASGVLAREAFCEEVIALVPDEDGTKAGLADVLGEALSALIDAAKEIYFRHEDDDLLRRKTIQTQVEATTWPEFSEVAP